MVYFSAWRMEIEIMAFQKQRFLQLFFFFFFFFFLERVTVGLFFFFFCWFFFTAFFVLFYFFLDLCEYKKWWRFTKMGDAEDWIAWMRSSSSSSNYADSKDSPPPSRSIYIYIYIYIYIPPFLSSIIPNRSSGQHSVLHRDDVSMYDFAGQPPLVPPWIGLQKRTSHEFVFTFPCSA